MEAAVALRKRTADKRKYATWNDTKAAAIAERAAFLWQTVRKVIRTLRWVPEPDPSLPVPQLPWSRRLRESFACDGKLRSYDACRKYWRHSEDAALSRRQADELEARAARLEARVRGAA
jgi:hypothetical protein